MCSQFTHKKNNIHLNSSAYQQVFLACRKAVLRIPVFTQRSQSYWVRHAHPDAVIPLPSDYCTFFLITALLLQEFHYLQGRKHISL